MRPLELAGHLLDRESLEVAEDHRESKGGRQSTDLVVQRLRLLAGYGWLIGRCAGSVSRPSVPPCSLRSSSRRSAASLLGRSARNTVQPVSQPVGVVNRAGLASQDEEGRLEGVLGMMPVTQELLANTQHHRPVPRHQDRESSLAGRITATDKPLDELAVGKPGDRAAREERLHRGTNDGDATRNIPGSLDQA